MASREAAITIDDSDDDEITFVGASTFTAKAIPATRTGRSSLTDTAKARLDDEGSNNGDSKIKIDLAALGAARKLRFERMKRARGDKSDDDDDDASAAYSNQKASKRSKFGSMSTLNRPPSPDDSDSDSYSEPSAPTFDRSAGQKASRAAKTNTGGRRVVGGRVDAQGAPYPSVPVMPESVTPITKEQRFWNGTVKLSKCFGASADQCGASLDDFIQPTTPRSAAGLEQAILVTYCGDPAWIASLFPKDPALELLLVFHGSPDSPVKGFIPYTSMPKWQMFFPTDNIKHHRFGVQMHSKFMLLAYPGSHLRFCVLTGNMMAYDWEHLENVAYIHDFKWVGKYGAPSCELAHELQEVLLSVQIRKTNPIFQAIRTGEYDLSTADFHLVRSEPSKLRRGWDEVQETGLGRLGAILDKMGFKAKPGGVQLEAQGSSLSKYRMVWLRSFHAVASGLMRSYLPFRKTVDYALTLTSVRGQRYNGPNAAEIARPGVNSKGTPAIKILFPSRRYVEHQSILGLQGGGSFYGSECNDSEIQALMHTPHPKRAAVMMHAKSLLALYSGAEMRELKGKAPPKSSIDNAAGGHQLIGGSSSTQKAKPKGRRLAASSTPDPVFSQTETEDEDDVDNELEELLFDEDARKYETKKQEDKDPLAGWVYMGSHNFTVAAWGNIAGTRSTPTLSTKNWELGIVLPVRSSDLAPSAHHSLARAVLAYKRNTVPYGPGDISWIPPHAQRTTEED